MTADLESDLRVVADHGPGRAGAQRGEAVMATWGPRATSFAAANRDSWTQFDKLDLVRIHTASTVMRSRAVTTAIAVARRFGAVTWAGTAYSGIRGLSIPAAPDR